MGRHLHADPRIVDGRGSVGPALALLLVTLLAACQQQQDPAATDPTRASPPSATATDGTPPSESAAASASPTVAPSTGAAGDPRDGTVDVLVFTRTEGFRHESIPDGIAAVEQIGAGRGWQVTATEDPTVFSDEGLGGYDVAVWLSTTGDVLDVDQQAAFERWYRAGGAWVGVHAAADTEYGWPWYGDLLGAWFRQHPPVQEARVLVEDDTHPSTEHLDDEWVRTDEWYDFRTDPGPDVRVLLTVDEDSYEGGDMGADHPVAWCQDFDGGRAWYTAGGHTEASFSEPDFLAHLAGGIASVVDGGGC